MGDSVVVVISPAVEWPNRLTDVVGGEVLVEHDVPDGLARITKVVQSGDQIRLVFVSIDTSQGPPAIQKVRELCPIALIIATSQFSIDALGVRAAFPAGANDFITETIDERALEKLKQKYFQAKPA